MFIKMNDKYLLGLVDNFAGVFVAYQTSRKTGVPVYFTNYEELDYDGADAVAKSLGKDTLVIVVDTTTDAEGKDAYIGNVYHTDIKAIESSFSDRVLFKKGFYEDTEDETYIYGKRHGLKTFYFGVPISGGYHITDNQLSVESIDKASDVLIDLVHWFKSK